MRKCIVAWAIGIALSLSLVQTRALAQSAPAAQQFADLGDFKLVSGESIQACKLGYRTLGQLNAAKSNAILMPTPFTSQSADLLDWVSGNEPLFDPSPYFLVIVDTLGDGVSCSPSTSVSQHGAAFPRFTIEDMVEAEHTLVTRTLGLSHLHAVIGVSMAGMQTFQWTVQYPEFMDEAIPIVGSPRPTSYDLLFYHTQEAALPNMTAARLLLTMNVYTPQYRVEHTSRSEFETFVKNATASDSTFDSSDWRAQVEAMLALDVAHGGALSAAATRVRARMLIVASQQDHAVNPGPALEFAQLVNAQTLVLQGDCGHIAPFCEVDKVRPVIDAFLRAVAVGALSYPQMAPINHYLMDQRAEIALARSAAPPSVSRHATILVLKQSGYEEVVAGTNGFVCDVDRSWLAAFDWPQYWNPKIRAAQCLNRNAARTIVPLDRLRTKMVLEGASTSEIIAAVRAAYAGGRVPELGPGAMCYMMSKYSYLTDDFPQDIPHLMFWVPTADRGALGADLAGSPVHFASYWPTSPQWVTAMRGIPAIGVFLVGVDRWSNGSRTSVHM